MNIVILILGIMYLLGFQVGKSLAICAILAGIFYLTDNLIIK